MSTMKDDIRAEVIQRLQFDFDLKVRTGSNYMRGGTCPKCRKKELYARHDNPWQIRCGRPERCGHIEHVKDLYDDLFEDWSKRAPATDNDPTVGPSALRAATKVFVNNRFEDVSEPRALEIDELPGIVNDFRQAAANAIAAGFDGVEIHGANGYLLDQFIKDGANLRTDAYGGSIANRARLLLEVTAAVAAEIGADRTGIRLSPVSPANGVSSSDPQAQFDYIVDQLNALDVVYLHVVEGATGGPRDVAPFDFDALRQRFKNTYIANNGYDLDLATARLAHDRADLIAFGRPFIANPDLVERLKTAAPLSAFDPSTLYGGGAAGYIDYPTLAESSTRAN